MAGNRKQPFGYRMEFGEYTPHPAEAETVRWIYQTYGWPVFQRCLYEI